MHTPHLTAPLLAPLQVDPANGDVYCLMTGIRLPGSPRNMANQARTGIYRMPRGGSTWTPLRGTVVVPPGVTDLPWYYPTSFAVDWSSGSAGARTDMLLMDMRNNGQASNGICGVWRTTDGGATWRFRQQTDGSTHVVFDRRRPSRVYASGMRSIDPWSTSQPGSWGYGGAHWSDDGGETWRLYEAMPMAANPYSVTPDPVDPCKVYYTTFGEWRGAAGCGS